MGERRAGLVRAGFRRANTPATTATGSSSPADWSTSLVRYFLLDPTNGVDTNRGYVDAAAGTTLTPTGLAKKTIAGLVAIIPLLGNGRVAVVLQAAGTVTETIDVSPFKGYAGFIWRGSTDLTNSAADRVQCGAAIATAGPGGSSEFTATAGATTTTVAIAVGSFGAEPTSIQFRIRFLAATTTAALRNICRVITAHTTTVLTLGNALPATPAAGDTFVIERPGAIVGQVIYDSAGGAPGSNVPLYQLVGIGCTSTAARGFLISGPALRLAFCECTGSTTTSVVQIGDTPSATVQNFYTDEAATTRAVGAGLRAACGVNVANVGQLTFTDSGFMHASQQVLVSRCSGGGIGARSYFACGINATDCGHGQLLDSANNSGSGGFVIGDGTTSNAQPRVVASAGNVAVVLNECSASVIRLDFANCTTACIRLNSHAYAGVVDVEGCTGSTGNTDVGLHVNVQASSASLASGITFVIGRRTANTVTGTAGDVRIGGAQNGGAPGGIITSWASFPVTGFVDCYGNRWIATDPGSSVSEIAEMPRGRRFLNGDGGSHAVGDVVRVSAADTVVKAQADTSAHVDGPLFVALTPPATGLPGLYAAMADPMKWLNFGSAPTVAALCYVDPSTAGRATTTVPAASGTNQKRRLGHVAKVQGSQGLVTGSPELLQVLSDGVAP